MRNYIAAGVIMLASLSACGGGGASSPAAVTPPISTPTTVPTTVPQTRTASIVWAGAAHPSGTTVAQSAGRKPLSGPPTPYPILLSVCDPTVEGCNSPDTQITAAANQSPAPTPSSTPSWTVTAPIALGPVVAGQTQGAFAGAQVTIGAPTGVAPGVYQAVAKFADATTATTAVNVYQHATMGYGHTVDSTSIAPKSYVAGYKFATGTNVADTTQADLWLDTTGIHCPAGCRVFMNGDPKQYAEPSFVNLTATDFASVSPSLWAADFTTMPVATYQQIVGTGIILVKGLDGSINKLLPTYIAPNVLAGLALSAAGGAAFAY